MCLCVCVSVCVCIVGLLLLGHAYCMPDVLIRSNMDGAASRVGILALTIKLTVLINRQIPWCQREAP